MWVHGTLLAFILLSHISPILFQVFFYMVLQKLMELNIPFNVEEIITDFELSIHKSIDEMMPELDILGCFFPFYKYQHLQ